MTPDPQTKLISVFVALAGLTVLFSIFGALHTLAGFGFITILEVLFRIVYTKPEKTP